MLRGKHVVAAKMLSGVVYQTRHFIDFCRIVNICLRVHYMYSLSMPIFTIGMLIVGSGFEKNMSAFCDKA